MAKWILNPPPKRLTVKEKRAAMLRQLRAQQKAERKRKRGKVSGDTDDGYYGFGRKPNKGGRMARRKKAKGSRRRPSAKQLAARKRFAAMARARGKAARSSTRKRRRPTVAKRRRKATRARKRTGTMRSVARRGSGASVSRAAWRASGYRRNPRRRRYRRNPMGFSPRGILGESFTLAKNTLAVMAGGTLGRTVTGMIPFGGTSPYMTAGKGLLVALAIQKFGSKVVSRDLAEMLAVGALMAPLRDAVIAVAPQAAPFLSGGYAFPTFPGSRMSSYASYAADGSLDAENTGGADLGGGVGAYATRDVWNG